VPAGRGVDAATLPAKASPRRARVFGDAGNRNGLGASEKFRYSAIIPKRASRFESDGSLVDRANFAPFPEISLRPAIIHNGDPKNSAKTEKPKGRLEFIDENGGGPRRAAAKAASEEELSRLRDSVARSPIA